MNRQNWTTEVKEEYIEEDNLLKEVVEGFGTEDWTKNAEQLRIKSSSALEKKRTGKQCRERWYNHLDPFVLKSRWRDEEESVLFEKHKVYGNKWKDLTKYLPGRTDNDIKNHFYSTLRRSLRRLNKYIGEKNSTNQMREIKPSVLTFIISYIYNQEGQEHNKVVNSRLLDSLKELPELIFKFSAFKPVKINMADKVDESLKTKILDIFHLVEEFKKVYGKEKGVEFEEMKESRKQIKSPQQESNVITALVDNESNIKMEEHEQEDEQKEEHQVESEDFISQICNFDKNNFLSKNHQLEFSPIVTIQRKSSTLEKQTSKKLVLIPKTDEKPNRLKPEEENFHLKSTNFNFQFLDERIDNQLMSIDEPSMDFNNESSHGHGHGQGLNDLVIIGKHIEPMECTWGCENAQMDEIDEILYENYQKK